MTRAVVTGTGAHTAVGDLAATVAALALDGDEREPSGAEQPRPAVSGVRRLTLPSAPPMEPRPGARAAPVDLEGLLGDKKLRKYMSDTTAMAVLASGRALSDGGLAADRPRRNETALFVATGLNPFDLTEAMPALRDGFDGRLDAATFRRCNPLLPFKMLLNMPLGLSSIVLGLEGENAALYPGSRQAAEALAIVVRGLARGRFPRALVGGSAQLFTVATLAVRASLHASEPSPPLGDGAAFLLVEDESEARARGASILAEVLGVGVSSAPAREGGGGPAVGRDEGLDTELDSELDEALARVFDGPATCAPSLIVTTGLSTAWARATVERALRRRLGAAPPRRLVELDPVLGFTGAAAFPLAAAVACDALGRAQRGRQTWDQGEAQRRTVHLALSRDLDGVVAALLLGEARASGRPRATENPPDDGDGGDANEPGGDALQMVAAPEVAFARSRQRSHRDEPQPGRRVVVTGLGAVTPIGASAAAYFAGLAAGRSGIGAVTRFDASSFDARVGAQVPALDTSALALPLDARAALEADPKSLFGLLAAREAIAQAFQGRPATEHHAPERLGASIATGLELCHVEALAPFLSREGLDVEGLLRASARRPPDARYVAPADLGARCILRELGARGPVLVNVSACAAGTQALGEGYRAIRDGAADAVLAGGYDSMLNPLGLGGFCMLGALSRRNELGPRASRPFDAERDGFVLGEGAGFVVLEALEHALRRGAEPLLEVLGYASSLDAFRVSDPHPEEAGAIRALRGALASAGLEPEDVNYVNAHGTGTPKNDPAETRAIKAVFPHAHRLPVSSTKSQIGHLIGAAGAVEFLAGAFAVRHGCLPATITLERADPECDLDYVPRVPRPALVRTFVSNSFGFGGQNAVIVAGALRASTRAQ